MKLKDLSDLKEEKFRNRRKEFMLRFNLINAIYNAEIK